MSIWDIFAEHFGDKTFDSIEEYNSEVMRLSASCEEELGEVVRYYLNKGLENE